MKRYHEIHQWLYRNDFDSSVTKYLLDWASEFWQAHRSESLAANILGFLKLTFAENEMLQGRRADFSEIIKWFRHHLERSPNYLPFYLNLAWALVIVNRMELALRVLHLAEKRLCDKKVLLDDLEGPVISPRDMYHDSFFLAETTLFINYYNRDNEELRKRLVVLFLSRIIETRGAIFESQGETTKAIGCYEKAQEWNSRCGVRLKIAKLYVEEGKLDLAEREFRDYLEVNPLDFAAQRQYARVLFDVGSYSACKEKCNQMLTVIRGVGLSGKGAAQIDRALETVFYQDLKMRMAQKSNRVALPAQPKLKH